eukprot:15033285-Ditylum_brightwellii.AAC.1
MPFCTTCNVSCPSDYQLQQHLRRKKHAQALKHGKSTNLTGGICFSFQKYGFCSKGPSCTFKHTSVGDSAVRSKSVTLDCGQAQKGPPPPGVCFIWWKKGVCYKGASCTYKHYKPEEPSEDEFQSVVAPSEGIVGDSAVSSKSVTLNCGQREGPPPPGVCFIWWKKGMCYKGATCTYKHYKPEESSDDAFQGAVVPSKTVVSLSSAITM